MSIAIGRCARRRAIIIFSRRDFTAVSTPPASIGSLAHGDFWTERWRWLPSGLLAASSSLILVVNVVVVPYPVDNDLDEIGWIAAHQSLSRPESLANWAYPFGYPLLLRLFTPLVGSLLITALIGSTVGATASLFFVYRITRWLMPASPGTAVAAAATAAVLLLPVATSEFSDNLTTALLLAGLYAVITRPASDRAVLVFGACAGLSLLLRFHYLLFLVIGPLGLAVLGETSRARWRAAGLFVAAYLVAALPFLVINTIVHGQPFHTGISPYMIGWRVDESIDFDNFPATFNLWPLSRLLAEKPMALAQLLYHYAQVLADAARDDRRHRADSLEHRLGAAGRAPACRHRAGCSAGALCRHGDRTVAVHAAGVRAGGLPGVRAVVPGVDRVEYAAAVASGWPPALVRLAWLSATLVLMYLGLGNPIRPLLDKHAQMTWNRQVLDTMREAGWRQDDKVFCNFWDLYNLDDPRFITFHNYGGYLLLDPLYNATMPRPEARSADEWQTFFDYHGTRFVVARPTEAITDFVEHRNPAQWPEIYRDEGVVIFKRAGAVAGADRQPGSAASLARGGPGRCRRDRRGAGACRPV